MIILNPAFLQHPPSRAVMATILLALLWTTLPLLTALPPAVMVVFACLWLLRMVLLQLNLNKMPLPVLIGLILVGGGLVWQQLGSVVGREGGISFLLLMIMLKAYEGNTQRDLQILLLAMLFLIGSSVLFNQSLLVGMWLLLSLFMVSICFAVLCGLDGKEAAKRGTQALMLTLPLMAVLFIAVPRKNEPFWRIPQQDKGKAQTGLSETMQPGSISDLVQSNELVANVTFNGRQPQQQELYWRAIIMADFNGISWRAVANDYIDNAQPQARSAAQMLDYQMILRDQNGIIPALDYPLPPNPNISSMQVRLGDVLRVRSRDGLRRVSLTATASDTLPHVLKEGEQALYLHLPASGNFRTRQLAQQLAAQSNSVRSFVDNTLNYYRRQQFSYTLQPPKAEGMDSIDTFMFTHKRGFCEHYAQSFVVMMRAAGVPARVVTGYLGGEYQSNGNFWQIRSKNAHAWAEVWLPNEQAWLRVDPTGAVSGRIQGGLDAALPENERELLPSQNSTWQTWAETGQFYWQQWVVNYDQSRQNSLFALLGLGSFNISSFALVLAVGLILACFPIWWWWREGRRQEQEPLVEGFLLLKATFLGEDDERLAAWSAHELQQWLQANHIHDPEINTLLAEYEYWYYATDKLPSKARQRAWLKRIHKVAKRHWQS